MAISTVNMNRFSLGFFLIILLASTVYGDSSQNLEYMIYWDVACPFVPAKVLFFVAYQDGDLKRISGESVPLDTKNGEPPSCFIGTAVPAAADVKELTFSALLVGKGRQFSFVPPIRWSSEVRPEIDSGPDKLRDYLMARKQELQTLRAEGKVKDDELAKLQHDAEIVGNFGRIIDAKEEIFRLKEQIGGLERHIEKLSHQLDLVRAQPAPRNFDRRESELTQQLSELTQLARKAEIDESDRRAKAEAALRREREAEAPPLEPPAATEDPHGVD